MKFCIDCKRYRPEISVKADSLSPAVARLLEVCLSPADPDLVSGKECFRVVGAKDARASEEMCGTEAKWFDPSTLDGRLAMLDEKGG